MQAHMSPISENIENLSRHIRALTLRERFWLLFRTSRNLSYQEQATILGNAGLQFVQRRLLLVFFRFIYQRVIKGTALSFICLFLVLGTIFLLAILERNLPNIVQPLLVSLIAFIAGFIFFTFQGIFHTIYQFVGRTLSAPDYKEIIQRVNNLDLVKKAEVLSTVSRDLVTEIAGSSLLASLLIGIALLVAAGMLLGIILVLSRFSILNEGILHTSYLIALASLAFAVCFGGLHWLSRKPSHLP